MIVSKGDPPILGRVLDSVDKELEYHRLIFVTNEPGARALRRIRDHKGEVHLESFGSLAKAREFAIGLVDCPWFLFVDDDVVLRRGFARIFSYMDDDVGAIEGLDCNVHPARRAFQEGMASLTKLLRKKSKSERGFTGSTLIRTKLLGSIQIPAYLKVYEDHYIKNHVQKQGYKWVQTKEYLSDHHDFKPPERAILAGQCAGRIGYLTLKTALSNFVKVFPKSVSAFLVTGEPSVIPYQIKWYWAYLKGYLSLVERRSPSP